MGAVDLLRVRVAALHAGEERAPRTRRWLCRTVMEMPGLLSPAGGRGAHRGECSVSGSDGPATSDECGTRMARKHPGTIVSFVGYAHGAGVLPPG